jgi:hypothetical protein
LLFICVYFTGYSPTGKSKIESIVKTVVKAAAGINKTMSKIIDNPLAYAECENIPTKTKIYREAGYKSWLVIFKVKSKQVTILGVLSGKQKAATFKSLTRQTLN